MADLVSRIYGGFRGIDLRSEDCHLSRSPDALNVWKDYREADSIRTRPGMEKICEFPEDRHGIKQVFGIHFYNDTMLVHSGENLYKVEYGTPTLLYSGLQRGIKAGVSFVFNDIWYYKDSANYLQYDGETIKEVEGYVPTTSIARKPAGGGTIYQDVNLLTGRRINTFLADGTSTEYVLDATMIDRGFEPIVKVDDWVVDNYTVDYGRGKIIFTEAPPAPKTDGQDNVSVEFQKVIGGYKNRILRCDLVQIFDNRVFVSGNHDYPNMVWHCALNDPTYFSDLDYYQDGQDEAAITGLVAGNNALWVFREPSDANTTVFYHVPTLDADYGKIYPSQHSSVSTGCVGGAINFNDDIVFVSERGLEGISGDITTEQVVAHRSSLIDRKLLTYNNLFDHLLLAEWEGYLFAFHYANVYLADSRTAFTNNDHIEYEWYWWDMGQSITAVKVHNGIMYLGTQDGLYTLTDNECDVESYWTTPKDKFKHPHKLKTTNKRGCVAEATGDVSVYAKLEDTDFELIGTYENVTDYFVSRIKRKKFKDIQLKFHSKTRFSLETVTLECFIGGYVKR